MPFGKCEFHGPSFLKSIGISQREPPKRPQLEQIFPRYNKAVQGKMNRAEFTRFMFDVIAAFEDDDSGDERPPEEELRSYCDEQFNQADKNNDGFLTLPELIEFFETMDSD